MNAATLPPSVLACLCVLIVSLGVFWKRFGIVPAVGMTTVMAMVVPRWVQFELVGIEWDTRAIFLVVAGAAVFLSKPNAFFEQIGLLDVLAVLAFLWIVIAETQSDSFDLARAAETYGGWLLPYLIGRCSIRSVTHMRLLAVTAAGVSVVFAVTAAAECFGVDLYELAFGDRPGLEFWPDKAKRGSLFRAEGPNRHPIFYGNMLLVLLPWTAWLAGAWRTIAPTYDEEASYRTIGWIGLIACVVAIGCTISRGPIGGIVIAGVVAFIAGYKWLSRITAILALAAFAVFAVKPSTLVDVTQAFVNIINEPQEIIEIDGEEMRTSSTLNRALILVGYRESLKQGGLFGYGYEKTKTFPFEVEKMPYDVLKKEPVKIVDNAYLYMALRSGWPFAVLLLLIFPVAILRIRKWPDISAVPLFRRLMTGTLVSLMVVIALVYPAYDHMLYVMWTLGLCAARVRS